MSFVFTNSSIDCEVYMNGTLDFLDYLEVELENGTKLSFETGSPDELVKNIGFDFSHFCDLRMLTIRLMSSDMGLIAPEVSFTLQNMTGYPSKSISGIMSGRMTCTLVFQRMKYKLC